MTEQAPPVRTLYRDGALADARSDRLRTGVSILVAGGRIAWIRPSDDEGPLEVEGAGAGTVEIVDASGSTFVPGMVDGHSHITMPGGAHWIQRGDDPPERLLEVAEMNARLQRESGVRWARDVGSVRRTVGDVDIERALALVVRDRWKGRREYPYVRAAGTWVTRAGTLPPGLSVEAETADEMKALALQQLDEGADFVKLYLDGPDPGVCPWSVDEVRAVVAACHARGARVTAHSGRLDGARVGAEAAVDSIEHGFEIDASVAAMMVRNHVRLVSTLVVFHSRVVFGRTTTIARFASDEGAATIRERIETAEASVSTAHRAGVEIAAGTDFGGGSPLANELPWEIEALVRAGLEPWEALAAATWRGGELLGEPEAGVIREGGPADFSVVHGDPLSDPTAMWRVWRVAWA